MISAKKIKTDTMSRKTGRDCSHFCLFPAILFIYKNHSHSQWWNIGTKASRPSEPTLLVANVHRANSPNLVRQGEGQLNFTSKSGRGQIKDSWVFRLEFINILLHLSNMLKHLDVFSEPTFFVKKTSHNKLANMGSKK